ncbi:hypothetical protein Lepto782_12470 [Leptospira interrogans serovar Canicola]|uniref:Uncharacterized protein n=1 Tax=Leptospira interrogans serovar Canicola TaxID=211880 RepID=A0AAP9WBT2_LEPIR|nr:hypothetical protein Lepto782_12470 [Leptospira interrogans serovar Canicola]
MEKSENLIKLLENYKIAPTQLVINSTEKSLLLTMKIEDLHENFGGMLSDFINLIPIYPN